MIVGKILNKFGLEGTIYRSVELYNKYSRELGSLFMKEELF